MTYSATRVHEGLVVVLDERGNVVAKCSDAGMAARITALLIVSERHEPAPPKPLQCPQCGGYESDVFDSRKTEHGVRRRRTCLACGAKYRTIEQVETLTTPGEDV